MARRARRGRRDQLHGVLVIDKPAGVTSAEVVADVCSRTGAGLAGHTGTLDPIATGVLPICLGAATKLAHWLLSDDKAYEAELELGLETDTLDLAGTVVRRDPAAAAAVTVAAIEAGLASLRGAQAQVPPMFSALKQGGVRLHELARAGVEVERAPRLVRIERLELLEVAAPRVRIALACSKGTYVRSVVRDLGAYLGCGATLTALRRTASGRFTLAAAVPLTAVTAEAAAAHLISAAAATGLPAVTVPPSLWPDVRDGRRIDPGLAGDLADGTFQMLSPAGDVLAICELGGGAIRFHRVLAYGMAGLDG